MRKAVTQFPGRWESISRTRSLRNLSPSKKKQLIVSSEESSCYTRKKPPHQSPINQSLEEGAHVPQSSEDSPIHQRKNPLSPSPMERLPEERDPASAKSTPATSLKPTSSVVWDKATRRQIPFSPSVITIIPRQYGARGAVGGETNVMSTSSGLPGTVVGSRWILTLQHKDGPDESGEEYKIDRNEEEEEEDTGDKIMGRGRAGA